MEGNLRIKINHCSDKISSCRVKRPRDHPTMAVLCQLCHASISKKKFMTVLWNPAEHFQHTGYHFNNMLTVWTFEIWLFPLINCDAFFFFCTLKYMSSEEQNVTLSLPTNFYCIVKSVFCIPLYLQNVSAAILTLTTTRTKADQVGQMLTYMSTIWTFETWFFQQINCYSFFFTWYNLFSNMSIAEQNVALSAYRFQL